MSVATRTRPVKLKGGPYHGWAGEFVEKDQKTVLLGPEGGKSFVYRRDERLDRPGKPAVFVYDRKETRVMLEMLGLPAELVDLAVSEAPTVLNRPATERDPESLITKINVAVRKNDAGVWEMVTEDGEVIATTPGPTIESPEAAKEWVASVMFPREEVSA